MARPDDIWRTAYRHPAIWDSSYEPLSLPDLFDAAAGSWPDRPLVDFFGRKYSYAECRDGADRVAAGLQALGIGKGDRVGLFLPNVPHYVAAYYGALKIGAVVVNFSPLYTVDELAAQVRDSGTRILFTLSAKALLPTALEVMARTSIEHLVVGSIAGALPPTKSVLYRLLRRDDEAERPHDPRLIAFSRLIDNDGRHTPATINAAADLALIQYTGGTTGTPKGAMLSHHNMTANARQVFDVDPHQDEPVRMMAVLPLFHIFANVVVLNRTLIGGGEMVMLPRFDAAQLLAAVERTGATMLPGVPTMFQALLDHPRIGRVDLSSLRVCISGGAPLPAEVKARFEAATGAILAEGYGLTESGIVSVNPYADLNKAGTIGQPLPGTTLAIVDREDPTRPPPAGEPGELVISGPQVMRGYWNRPDADAGTFAAGALRTGDVALIDDDGYVRIVDRIKDMIAVGGFKVYPSQVEAVLYRHPHVKEAIVIGVPDTYHGEMPKAFVTLAEGAAESGESLRDWLNPQLGKHERVIAVEIRDSLPKTLVGKLSRKELVAEEKAKSSARLAPGA